MGPTAIGYQALMNGSTVFQGITAIGNKALQKLTTGGNGTTAIGSESLTAVTDSRNDTADRPWCGHALITARATTPLSALGPGIGWVPLQAEGGTQTYSTTNAEGHTCIGYNTGLSSTKQVNHITVIGADAEVQEQGNIAIGY